MAREGYSKEDALQRIFALKYNSQNPQDRVEFTRAEVRQAIVDTDWTPPDNLNNFVKDLIRSGSHDPRCENARKAGYGLVESEHEGSAFGAFFRITEENVKEVTVRCPDDLEAIVLKASVPSDVSDLVRTDEGGLLSVLEYTRMLDAFLTLTRREHVQRVQVPVKLRNEIDGFYVFRSHGERIAVPCEAKSRGSDEIQMNQIVGNVRRTLDPKNSLMGSDMRHVIPIAAKVLMDGDVYLVQFPTCSAEDVAMLTQKLVGSNLVQQRRYRLDPPLPKWTRAAGARRRRAIRRANAGQLPLP